MVLAKVVIVTTVNSVAMDPNDPTKLVVDFSYTPVQPVQSISISINLPDLSWQSHLRALKYLYVDWQNNIDAVTADMQKMFPGNYTVECYSDWDEMRMLPRLQFDTPQDGTWFMLRYS